MFQGLVLLAVLIGLPFLFKYLLSGLLPMVCSFLALYLVVKFFA